MFKKIVMMSLFSMISLFAASDDAPWAWIHHKNYNAIARITHKTKKMLLFEKENIQPFTQLIFSWNASRPEQGHFSFYVQVRDVATQRWGMWHHMADWGNAIQQSYMSKSDGTSSFVHVRLEIESKKYADAFRIKIIPQKSASLASVHRLSVALADFNGLKAENSVDQLPSVHIVGVPLIAQFALDHPDASRICSPVSCAMLIDFLTHKEKDPIDCALNSFDNGLGVYGSWPYNMAHAFEACEGKVHFSVQRMNTFADLHQRLMSEMPVIVSVRGTLPGALKAFPHGHLIVVVGWDNATREVLCHDPAAERHEDVFKRYPIEDFLRAWERSHRLAYIAEFA